ncbi:hypothetical protein Baya_9504 [Bagarius yarrelli]|uniref:Uncharacterized protein n=1 Tax=Bagarius yarrelli TaxID=175774 RepID=A0A556U8I3_BAGYA|nr:hypothetical protein Baya_9504 [Bagarius yarrelli]
MRGKKERKKLNEERKEKLNKTGGEEKNPSIKKQDEKRQKLRGKGKERKVEKEKKGKERGVKKSCPAGVKGHAGRTGGRARFGAAAEFDLNLVTSDKAAHYIRPFKPNPLETKQNDSGTFQGTAGTGWALASAMVRTLLVPTRLAPTQLRILVPHLDEGQRNSPFMPASPVSKHMAVEHLEKAQE